LQRNFFAILLKAFSFFPLKHTLHFPKKVAKLSVSCRYTANKNSKTLNAAT